MDPVKLFIAVSYLEKLKRNLIDSIKEKISFSRDFFIWE
jgi:hypothetical protein